MNKYVFMEQGNTLSQVEGNFIIQETIPRGIYNLCFDKMRGLFLEKIAEQFYFDYKLYGVDYRLINHVKRYYASKPSGNIGVLLTGTRGTGKSVTAKLLANELALPVILINANFPGLTDFISKCQQDVIFFLDEFEKNFAYKNCEDENMAGGDLLSVMDGVYNSSYTQIFLLTTNYLRVNENLLSRPSRIRYLKEFNDVLDESVVREFIADNLKDMSKAKEVIDFINLLKFSTIDIVKSIIDEINIQNCSISDIKDIFNVDTCDYRVSFDYISSNVNDSKFWKAIPDTKTFAKFCELSYEDRQKLNIRIYFNCCTENCPFKSYEIGDEFNGAQIIDIDTVNNIIVTKDDLQGYKYMYHIISWSKSSGVNYTNAYKMI